MATFVDTDREQREYDLARQNRQDRSLDRFVTGLSSLERSKKEDAKTKRQRAFQEMQFRSQMAQQGQVLDPEESAAVTESFQSGDYGSLAPVFQKFGESTRDLKEREQASKEAGRAEQREMRRLQKKNLQMQVDEKTSPKAKQMSAKDVMNVQEGAQIPVMLADVDSVIAKNEDLFDPIKGRLQSLNPYDTRTQTIEAQIRAASQAFGKFMEGGVLRKEDEEKYKRMMPQIGDTPQVAKNKLKVVQRLLVQKQKGNLDALKKAGYDVTPFKDMGDAPDMPGVGASRPMVAGAVPVGLSAPNLAPGTEVAFDPTKEPVIPDVITSATAAPMEVPAQQHPQANQAVEWAQKNPNDPRAAQILQSLGLGGQ
jgi:hypothetical protein